jgi:hypothetical protein
LNGQTDTPPWIATLNESFDGVVIGGGPAGSNDAGEAHPVVVEGISMALQSA